MDRFGLHTLDLLASVLCWSCFGAMAMYRWCSPAGLAWITAHPDLCNCLGRMGVKSCPFWPHSRSSLRDFFRSWMLWVLCCVTPGVTSAKAGRSGLRVKYCTPPAPCKLGLLSTVFGTLEQSLGLPSVVIKALKRQKEPRRAKWAYHHFGRVSVTDSAIFCWAQSDADRTDRTKDQAVKQRLGLSARFILDFARALLQISGNSFSVQHVKVVCHEGHLDSSGCELGPFQHTDSPLWIFFLTNQHWTLLHCFCDGPSLRVQQYDGLAWTSLSALAPVVSTLKREWDMQHVLLQSSWDFQQHQNDLSGTLVLAHFAYHVGSFTYEQAVNFEASHDSFAVCSSAMLSPGLCGFGPDEIAVISTLEQILPSKGVPVAEVPHRATVPRWLGCQRTFDWDRHSCATKQYSYGHYLCSCWGRPPQPSTVCWAPSYHQCTEFF